MSATELPIPNPDAILTGPFWPGPVRVLRASGDEGSIRIEAVGLADSMYSDRTLTVQQFRDLVSEQDDLSPGPTTVRRSTRWSASSVVERRRLIVIASLPEKESAHPRRQRRLMPRRSMAAAEPVKLPK